MYTELLFKSSPSATSNAFLEQQLWLYAYGSVVAFAMHVFARPEFGPFDLLSSIKGEAKLLLIISSVARCSSPITTVGRTIYSYTNTSN